MMKVKVYPNSEKIETELSKKFRSIRSIRREIKKAIKRFGNNISKADITVDLLKCNQKDPDNKTPDFEVVVEIASDERLELYADAIRDYIAEVFFDQGFKRGYSFNIWIKIFPGSWSSFKNGRRIEKVDVEPDK